MKFLTLLFFFVTTQTYASIVCNYEETTDFTLAVKDGLGKKVRVSEDHKKFTSTEKAMIFRAVTVQKWLKIKSEAEALDAFGDYRGTHGEAGADAGSIEYFAVNNEKLAIVTYYPGENEYGAIFELNESGKFSVVAEVGDSFITCLK